MSNDTLSLDLDLTGNQQLTVIADKTPAMVKVINLNTDKVFDEEAPRIQVVLESQDHEDAPDIYHTLWLPKQGDSEKRIKRAKQGIKDFLSAIGLDPEVAKIEPEEWLDKNAESVIGQREGQNGEPQNFIKKWVLSSGDDTEE